MDKKRKDDILKEYKELTYPTLTNYPQSSFVNTQWEKVNGVFKKFSLYEDNYYSVSSLSNGKINK